MELSVLNRWIALMRHVSDAAYKNEARALFDDLKARYSAADRRYHDFQHIIDCLRQLDEVNDLARDLNAVELAIWFHDVVYDSRRSDNEECSAVLAVERLNRLGVPNTSIQVVGDLILATRHNAPPATPDAALLMDIDLSILGQPAREFDAYEEGVRYEYAWVSEADFRAGRSKILRRFLMQPRIYFTDHFYAALEKCARENLVRSLSRLENAV